MAVALFVYNSHFNNSNVGQQLNTSAFSGYQVVANFNGTNLFTNNIGGGVVVSESRVNVKGNLSFKGNVAVNGGGLAMFGRCLVSVLCIIILLPVYVYVCKSFRCYVYTIEVPPSSFETL